MVAKELAKQGFGVGLIPMALTNDFAMFEVEDLTNNLTTILCFNGAGINIKALPFVHWFDSASSGPGPFVDFATTSPTSFGELAGRAAIGAIASNSTIHLDFKSLHFARRGVRTIPTPLSLELAEHLASSCYSAAEGNLTRCTPSLPIPRKSFRGRAQMETRRELILGR